VQPSQQHQGDNSADPSAAKTGYALFDLDQTLVPWDTQLLFCNYILKRMPLRRLYLLILIPFLMLTKLLGAGGMKRVFLNYLVGLSRDELQEFAAEFVEQHLPHSFYAEMLELVEQQKKLGRTMILSSASPDIWVMPIAEKLGFDHCFATTLEIQGRVQLFPELQQPCILRQPCSPSHVTDLRTRHHGAPHGKTAPRRAKTWLATCYS